MNGVKKKLICENLRNWYFIDSVLLNGHAKNVITDDKDYKEYVSCKAALLSDLYEFYNHIRYISPSKEKAATTNELQKWAVMEAKRSKKIAASMIQTEDFKKSLKQRILKEFAVIKNKVSEDKHEVAYDKLAESVLMERFAKMSLDNTLLALPVIECLSPEKAEDFRGELLEQSYMMIRSELINIAKKHGAVFNPNVVTEISSGALKMIGGVILGFTLLGPTVRTIEASDSRCKNRCGRFAVANNAKKACIYKCEIQTRQQIISGLRQMAAQTNNSKARNKFARDVKKAQMQMASYQRKLANLTATRAGADEAGEASDRSRLL